jgi:hypothetical protein
LRSLRPFPDCLLAFLETDVSNRQFGYDLLLMPVESDAPEEEGEPAPTVMLMRTNVTSFKERVDKAAAAMTMFSTLGVDTSAAPTTDNNATSGSGSSGAATVEVTKPLNQLYVPPTKKAMIFGSSSASKLFGGKSRANAGTSAGAQDADGGGDDVDVRLSHDDNDVEADLRMLSDDESDADDGEERRPGSMVIVVNNPDGDLHNTSNDTTGEEDADLEDRDSSGDELYGSGVRSQHSLVSRLAADHEESKESAVSAHATRANTHVNSKHAVTSTSTSTSANSPTRPKKKKTSVASMFGFKSSSKEKEAGAGDKKKSSSSARATDSSSSLVSSLKHFSAHELAEWPALQLRELLMMLHFLNVQAVGKRGQTQSQSQSQSGGAGSGGSTAVNAHNKHMMTNYFVPGAASSDDYLSAYETLILSSSAKCSAKQQAQASGSGSGSGAATSTNCHSLWLSQWRVRNALLSTTAFNEWAQGLHLLKTVDLKTARAMNNDQKLSFCLNLYNLMSVFASIVLPWPRLLDVAGRVNWQRNVKFAVGGTSSSCICSLLQLEHCILRSNLTNLELPSFFMTEVRIFMTLCVVF